MLSLLIAAALAAASPASPPSRAEPPPAPPKVFQQAGYAQPDIEPAACKALNAGETQCAVPAMTAGVYLVRATATSTAQAPGAAQQITIVAGAQSCNST